MWEKCRAVQSLMAGRSSPKVSGTMSSSLPTKMARSRIQGVTVDVLDHLGVVVGGQEGFPSPPSGIGR